MVDEPNSDGSKDANRVAANDEHPPTFREVVRRPCQLSDKARVGVMLPC